MNIGRILYAILKRGRPYVDFEENLWIAHANGEYVGELNHSRKFVPVIRTIISNVLDNALKEYLLSLLPSTQCRPFVCIAADKMTPKKRLATQMTMENTELYCFILGLVKFTVAWFSPLNRRNWCPPFA